MNCIYWSDTNTFKLAILIKDSYLVEDQIQQFYTNDLVNLGISLDDIICLGLPYPTAKLNATQCREQITKMVSTIIRLGITHLYVADASYFKVLAKVTSTEKQLYKELNCKFTGLEHLKLIYGINYGQLMYNDNLAHRLETTIKTLASSLNGSYKPLQLITDPSSILSTTDAIKDALESLHKHSMLTCDIETYSLSLKNAGLASIAFAWNNHQGIVFHVNQEIRILLKRFFESYKGTLIFHNASFDIKQIIFSCFMKHPLDYQGMLHGLHTMCRSVHDTMIIAYLATNSTAGNELGLKTLAQEFAGDYAEDVNDITALEPTKLLEYNLKDTMATYYVFEKYYPIMLKDNQLNIYKTIMLPSLKVLIQLELCGMPIDLDEVHILHQNLKTKSDMYKDTILNHFATKQALQDIKHKKLKTMNAKLKTKQHTIDILDDYEFNPNSNDHISHLLYQVIQAPILDYTASKQPATSTNTIAKLINHVDDKYHDLLQAMIDYNAVTKILSSFIPSFLDAFVKDNGAYLHGSFKLGGTLSGRLSCSNPNLQQLPSGSTYGKDVKKCFKAPKGWLFVGADFSSLEDRINALLTKDENKLKVYTDGFDGHSLRAYYYWKDKMPDITDTIESINSIKHKYPKYRQSSKAPTFALTFGGTYITLMNNCGFTEQEAKQIEANYHELYKQSDDWIADKLKLCEQQGYIDVAFGLRIRTPIVGKTVLGTSKTPYMATAEARSVGNAISGQSYGMLTNRAINEFMERVWASEYKYDILPVALIHDAIYLMIKDDVRVVEWVNNNLIECMQWQELPEIQHDQVHLEAELDVYYPSWANAITLPNQVNQQQIKQICLNGLN